MGDSNQQQYYQNTQQVPQNVFQQPMYNAQVPGQPQYGYDNNQMYGSQMNYPDQYQQQQPYYDEGYEEDDYDNLELIQKELDKSNSFNNFDETEEDVFVAEVEKEIGRSDVGNTPLVNGQLSQHAADFWFPECRNCPCCSGFKHGCKCCKGGPVHTCTDPNCVDKEFSQQVNSNLASRGVESVADKSGSGSTSTSSAYKVTTPPKPSAVPVGPQDICRFESGPGGCRYGASCRFKHNFPPSTGSNYSAPPSAPVANGPPGAKTRCIFFAKGTCQFGDSCRNGHY